MKRSQFVDCLTADLESMGIHKLTYKEECDLSRRAQRGDKQASDWLISCNVPLVIKIARYYASGFYYIFDELVQDGLIGLAKAVPRYRPIHKGNPIRFGTYATYWIKAEIRERMSKHYLRVKVPDGIVQLRNRLIDFRAKFTATHDRVPTPKEEREAMKLGENQYTDLLKADVAVRSSTQARNALADAASDGSDLKTKRDVAFDMLVTPGDSTADAAIANVEREALREHFNKLLGTLDVRERQVARCRLLAHDPMGLRELSADMGISKERVRQIQERTIHKIKQYFSTVANMAQCA
jgi:RNA polymerase sigma factor (sigma-70 family)